MSREECGRIFTLLAQFYPRETCVKTRCWREAWVLGLAPYGYDAVKERILRYAARKRYFPALADITLHLPRRCIGIPLPPTVEVCPILHTHGGAVGVTLQRYAPEGCIGCKREGHCPYFVLLKQKKKNAEA